uniref:Uncharacterized protein n=1 Tax=Arundo donax TaxID=35708 RepID=A0A0A9CJF1_ARUDO
MPLAPPTSPSLAIVWPSKTALALAMELLLTGADLPVPVWSICCLAPTAFSTFSSKTALAF